MVRQLPWFGSSQVRQYPWSGNSHDSAVPWFRQPLVVAEQFPIVLECYKVSDFRDAGLIAKIFARMLPV
jgi:hypothetical protein